MKIIEALKKVKSNRVKMTDLIGLISANSAHMESASKSLPYANPSEKVKEWLQSVADLEKDNARLLTRIQRTNLNTQVTIEMPNGVSVTKSIAEWIVRRREGIAIEVNAYTHLYAGNLKQSASKDSEGNIIIDNVVRNYDQEKRDIRLSHLNEERSLIDGTLEIINAVTDLEE